MTEEQTKELRTALLNHVSKGLNGNFLTESKIFVTPKIARIAVETGLLQEKFVDTFKRALLDFIIRVTTKSAKSEEFEILPEIVELLIDFDSLYGIRKEQ